jgi:uncharacterized caspase-like protein
LYVLQVISLAWLTLLCAFATGQAAEKRVALVVGNAAYRHGDVPRLDNPVNDARGMRDALKALGFEVIYGEDLNLRNLGRAIGQFAGRVKDADVAIVYFAGHGSTFDGAPYVAPVDAEFSSLTEVTHELVPVETLIADLRQAKGVRIAILDACRDNSAEQGLKRQALRGGGDLTRGLAPMKNVSGMIIAYATQYGATAGDNAGAPGGWFGSSTRHSPFTAALLNNIATPGLDVKDMFFKVGSEVDAATGGTQRPEISISMYGRYVLAPDTRKPATAATSGSAPAMAALPDAQPGGNAAVVTAPVKPAAPQQMAAAPAAAPSRSASPASERAQQMMKKGAELVANGDVAAGRLMWRRAAEAGEAAGAFALAETYDPLELAKGRVIGRAGANVELAWKWYEKARELGSTAAQERLERLDRMPER